MTTIFNGNIPTPILQPSKTLIPLPTGDTRTTVLFSTWAMRNPEQAAGRWWEVPFLGKPSMLAERDQIRAEVSKVFKTTIGRGR